MSDTKILPGALPVDSEYFVAVDNVTITGDGTGLDPLRVIGSIGGSAIKVLYTATGGEGTSFQVPIGTTLSNVNYGVAWQAISAVYVPMSVETPISGRTTSTFPVILSFAPTLGDIFEFMVFPQ